jgi:hypothetical protein
MHCTNCTSVLRAYPNNQAARRAIKPQGEVEEGKILLTLFLPAYQMAAKPIEPSLSAGNRSAPHTLARFTCDLLMPLGQQQPFDARFPAVGRIGAGFLRRRGHRSVHPQPLPINALQFIERFNADLSQVQNPPEATHARHRP